MLFLNKQSFASYLNKKLKSEKSINENLKFLDMGQNFFNEIGVVKSEDFTADSIAAYHKKFGVSGGWGKLEKFHKCMQHYAESIEQGFHDSNPENERVATEIRKYYYKDPAAELEEHKYAAQQYVNYAKSLILPLPEGVRINSAYLGTLDNDEFVDAFCDLRYTIIAMYDDIHKAPFEWGYPAKAVSDEYRNRVNDILFALVQNGAYHNGVLIVDAKSFFGCTLVKRHQKVELMIHGFKQFGFTFDGYAQKADEFHVSHIDNPNIITVLNAYVCANKPGASHEPLHGFSYRYVQDPNEQDYEMCFLARMDYEPQELVKIQQWLHAEAAACGYKIDPEKLTDKNMILYKKGSKQFLLVGYGYEKTKSQIVSKVILRKVFETHPKRVEQVAKLFPEVFIPKTYACGTPKCGTCNMAIKYELFEKKYSACAYESFWFRGVTFENIGALLELFKLENGM